MYYPILKGKQYELAAINELVVSLPLGNVCPILEPVNSNLAGIAKTISELSGVGVTPWVVINPSQRDFRGAGTDITHLLVSSLSSVSSGAGAFIPCVKVSGPSDHLAISLLRNFPNKFVAYVEGAIDLSLSKDLARASIVALNPYKVEYPLWASIPSVVLFRDGFEKKSRNLDYPSESFYSPLHIDYKAHPNAIGFGDYTIVSERFSEGGGPAYVVTLHLSYHDLSRSGHMYMSHFSSFSDTNNQSDIAGKFREALDLLMTHHHGHPGKYLNTHGMQAFSALHASRHYPNLGIVKKHAIKHHVQTLSLS